MSVLRSHLDSAKRAYRAAHYDGDLAEELLPSRPSVAEQFNDRRRLMWGGLAGAAAAAALAISLALPHLITSREPSRPQSSTGGAVSFSLLVSPRDMPLPHIESPLPLPPRGLRAPDLQPAVWRYQDMAAQYRQFKLPDSLKSATVPTIPTDLPSRGLEWFQRVWNHESRRDA